MQYITINNKSYVLADDLFSAIPTFCKDARNSRELIKNRNIKDFVYARNKNNNWTITDGKSNRYDKILINKTYIDNNIDDIKDQEIDIAPDIILLEDHEKFKDDEGKIIEIETRGDRDVNNIYFKLKDVSLGFNLDNLYDIVTQKISNYIIDVDYKYFNCRKTISNSKISYSKKIYLTYEGILRVLFVNKSRKTKKFITWATKTLFVAQLGSKEEKEELASNLIGVNVKNVRQVFNLTKNDTPGVYLINCGKAKDLLGDNYSDNDLICKFGCSKDINRRLAEHDINFKKEFNTPIEVLCYSIIDPKYIFEAESCLNQYFKYNIIDYKNMKELVVINTKELNQIKIQYKMIHNSYIGCYEKLNQKIIELNNELEKEKHNLELEKEKHKLDLEKEKYNSKLNDEKHKLEIEKTNSKLLEEKYKNELKDKDIELLQYKIKLLEHNIK